MSQFKKYFKIIQESEESPLKSIIFNGEFYTLTTKEKVEVKDYDLENNEQKPNGLWFTKGDEWIQFLIDNSVIDEDGITTPHKSIFPDYKVKNIAKIRINNAKIIVIDEQKELDFFIQGYGIKNEYNSLKSVFSFNWKTFSTDYKIDGVYINSYKLPTSYHLNSIWDVPSGCIWNTNGKISQIEIIPIKNYKKFF